jgi:hypothetical protein
MPLDGITLRAVTEELSFLKGASVQKVHQPERDEILLLLHTQSGNKKLLISASPNSPRLHITEGEYKNPDNPPMFCMLLRKHFTGGRIITITQLSLDRVVDAFGNKATFLEQKKAVERLGENAVKLANAFPELDFSRTLGFQNNDEIVIFIVETSDEEAVRFALQNGDVVELVSPAPLRDRILDITAKMTARHKKAKR